MATKAATASTPAAVRMKQGDRFLRIKDVLARVPINRVTLWKLEQDGKFPKHITIASRTPVYLESEVEAWMAQRLAASDAA
jgi:prophage regulatory protein